MLEQKYEKEQAEENKHTYPGVVPEPPRWIGIKDTLPEKNKKTPPQKEQKLTGDHCTGLEGLGHHACLFLEIGPAQVTIDPKAKAAKSSI